MKYFYVILICVLGVENISAQTLYPEVMEKRNGLNGAVYNRLTPPSFFPRRLFFKRLENAIIENPSVRYSVQNLKKEKFVDPNVTDAVNTLIKYAEDERLKYVIDYLKKYANGNIAQQEKALNVLQERITSDSMEYYRKNADLLTGDYEDYLNTDMQTFVHHVQQDSNYIWLRNANRDSVFMEVMNMSDNSIRFWMNNGQMKYHRFWAANREGDTIGSWIQVFPRDNKLKIYLDEDVYQKTGIEKKHSGVQENINNQPQKEYFLIKPIVTDALRRKYWTYYSEVELTMSQGKLVNWASGGENSLSLLSNLRYYWNYNRNKTSWESWMHYRFGFMKNGSEDIRKNEDRFELNSKVGQKAFKHWYYTAQFNTLTQLFNSYDYPKDKPRKLVANFMSPGYFTLSLGMDFKPHNNFSLVISPIAGKWNFVRDTAEIEVKRYGIEAGKRFKREAGAQINLISKLNNLLKILDLNNELKMFMSYEQKDRYINKGKPDEEKKRLPLTVNWKMTLYFKINYFMSTSIYTETIYDENYSRKLQFKENLNLGVKFRF